MLVINVGKKCGIFTEVNNEVFETFLKKKAGGVYHNYSMQEMALALTMQNTHFQL